MSCAYIQDLANTLWVDMGEPTSVTPGTIAAQLTSDFYLGKLSAILGVCFSTDCDGCIQPTLDPSQQAILGSIYLVGYYGRLVMTTNGAGGVMMVSEIREADTVIRYQTNSERAKAYVQLLSSAQTQLDNLVRSYFDLGQGADVPRSVDFFGIM